MMAYSRRRMPTMSELRGIFLVILGAGALGFYYHWWFLADRLFSPWLFIGFIIAVVYGGIQIMGNWVLYLATHHRSQQFARPAELGLSVDVFVTVCDEEHGLIRRTLEAVRQMVGEHQIWLLDDGADPALAKLAAQMEVGYLAREERDDAKAGNLNAALARTQGDIVVIFDIDHAPRVDFLEQTLGYFVDPQVGFVQVMLTFANNSDGWVPEAAAESSLDFYNPTSLGADGLRGATLIGSNALIRREALQSIKRYQPGLAEDLATSIALHAAGWRSVYVREPLAPGLAPPDLISWFTQQLKWARGVFELLLTAYPRYFRRLEFGQKLSYAVRMTYYWIGPVVAIHQFLTLYVLYKATPEALSELENYLFHLAPLALLVLSIRQLALRRWRHHSLENRLQWRALTLVFATWPIYTLAWLMALLRLPLDFRSTPKTAAGTIHPLWLAPQMVTTILLLGGLLNALLSGGDTIYPLVYSFTIVQVIAQLLLVSQKLLIAVRPVARRAQDLAVVRRLSGEAKTLRPNRPTHDRGRHRADVEEGASD